MMELKGFLPILLIGICVLQANFGSCYKNEVEITPAPPEEATTQKSGFFSGIKNFFRGSPTTTTTTTTLRPTLLIPQAPLMPLGPRPDTPSSSPFGGHPQQPPQWPQMGPTVPSTSTTTIRPHSPVLPHQPQQPHMPSHAQTTNTQGERFGSSSGNFPSGFTPYRQNIPQPSGYDLSYGGGNTDGKPMTGGNRPGFGLAPMTSSTTTTTTFRPSAAQQPQSPNMNIDLRFGTTTTTRRPTEKEEFPGLPPPRRPSTGSRDEFPPLPAPKSPVSTPISPNSYPSSPSAWGTTPLPPRTAAGALTPSSPHSPTHPGSPPAQPHGTGNRVSFIPTVSTSTTMRPGTQTSGEYSLATDEEIRQLTESLYAKENSNLLDLIQVNVQGRTRSIDSADEAPNPLLTVDERALQLPTIVKMRELFNNYDVDISVNEHVTPNEHREENEFVDAVMSTAVMRQAMLFLQNKGIVTPDPKTHRDLVKEIWFTQYSRGRGKIGSSGFEHVFVNEVNNGTLIGLHNWVYFYEEEKAGRLDYKGYMKVLDVGSKAKIVKARFTHNGLNKPVNTLFIGTSPELELALYTVCLKLRPIQGCPISMGNSRFEIMVYPWRYRGKNFVGSAYPEI